MSPARSTPVLASAAVAVLALLWLSLFTVSENEFAVRSRLGKIQPETYAPGLHWCWPFESIARVERRVIGQRLQGETFLTAEQQALVLDIDLSWRGRDAAARKGSPCRDRKSTRLNSSHQIISYAVFCF